LEPFCAIARTVPIGKLVFVDDVPVYTSAAINPSACVWLVAVTEFVVVFVMSDGVPNVSVRVAASDPPPAKPLPAVMEVPLLAGV
jgi:hypothetical protein